MHCQLLIANCPIADCMLPIVKYLLLSCDKSVQPEASRLQLLSRSSQRKAHSS